MFDDIVIPVFSWRELEGKTIKIISARETKDGPVVIVGISHEDNGRIYILDMKEGK